MTAKTRELWARQDQHEGDRWRLFRAVAAHIDARSVLYPGSYVDVSASFVFPAVTYVDIDKRARAFFADGDEVRAIVAEHDGSPADPSIEFLHADYRTALGLADESFDLLVSLYAGFVSESCTRYLRPGGTLLVNSSHGDAAMASIDPRLELSAVVVARDAQYRVSSAALDTHLVPRKPVSITRDLIHELGRGIAYTRSPFAYLFRRVDGARASAAYR